MPSYSNFSPKQLLLHHHVPVSPSTNSELLQALESGTVDKSQPYLLTASMQTAGRGQRSRSWHSPIGNIYMSLYHPLTTPLSGLLSLVVGYHLTQLPIIQKLNRQRKSYGAPIIGVKWANDIGYYHTPPHAPLAQSNKIQFKKLAGILIEPVLTDNQITGVVVGVGMNINTAPQLNSETQEGMSYQAVSLSQIIQQTQEDVRANQAGNCQEGKRQSENWQEVNLQERNWQEDNYHGNKRNSAQYNNQHCPQQTSIDTASIDTSNNALNNTSNNTSNNALNDASNDLASLPRAEDLYFSVSATILRALEQYTSFHHSAYAVTKFLNDYDSVNVLIGRHVQIQQQLINYPEESKKGTQQSKQTYVHGVVVGINPDGSLKIRHGDKNSPLTTDVYTGTIRISDNV